jgi:hypothetical protein
MRSSNGVTRKSKLEAPHGHEQPSLSASQAPRIPNYRLEQLKKNWNRLFGAAEADLFRRQLGTNEPVCPCAGNGPPAWLHFFLKYSNAWIPTGGSGLFGGLEAFDHELANSNLEGRLVSLGYTAARSSGSGSISAWRRIPLPWRC